MSSDTFTVRVTRVNGAELSSWPELSSGAEAEADAEAGAGAEAEAEAAAEADAAAEAEAAAGADAGTNRIGAGSLDLALTCRAGMAVEATTHFAAQVLADLLGVEEILALLPEADLQSPFSYASKWLLAHADKVIDKTSIKIYNEVNHPPVELSYHELRTTLRARFGPQWSTEPLTVIREVAAEMAHLGEALEFAEEPEFYTTGALDDLLEELVSAQLQAAPQASAALHFRVRDARWIAHLEPGDEVGSAASP